MEGEIALEIFVNTGKRSGDTSQGHSLDSRKEATVFSFHDGHDALEDACTAVKDDF